MTPILKILIKNVTVFRDDSLFRHKFYFYFVN
jgi:hypothetical protein